MKTGVSHTEAVYGLTDLTPSQASASELLGYVRGQWLIENQSHWTRDVVFDEDRSQVRVGSIPELMAALRNAVIGLLWISHEPKIAAATRCFAAQPWAALRLLGVSRDN